MLIQYQNVELLRAENLILQDVNFSLDKGDFVYLIGKVGSGKSTLLKSLYGEIEVKVGEAQIFDFDLTKMKRKQLPSLRRKIGIVFQDFQLLTDRSVEKNLRFVLKATGWTDNDRINYRIEEVLDRVGMENKGYKMPHALSGGEQQRIVIARALLNSPELILADEPTGNLDPETSRQIVDLLRSIREQGTAVIMSTHNYSVINEFPERILHCIDGRLVDEAASLDV